MFSILPPQDGFQLKFWKSLADRGPLQGRRRQCNSIWLEDGTRAQSCHLTSLWKFCHRHFDRRMVPEPLSCQSLWFRSQFSCTRTLLWNSVSCIALAAAPGVNIAESTLAHLPTAPLFIVECYSWHFWQRHFVQTRLGSFHQFATSYFRPFVYVCPIGDLPFKNSEIIF